jgi:hypothetical protein
VVVTCASTPLRPDQRSATSARASGSRAISSGSGCKACTDRRASDRLSRASRIAESKWWRHWPAGFPDSAGVPGPGGAAARPAASSWVMIPARPWARVSWISRAIRCRSSSTPASRAWASSWACRPAFSSSDAVSLRLASLSSVTSRPRRSLRSALTQPNHDREPATSMLIKTITAHTATDPAPWCGSPPFCDVPVIRAIVATPSSRHFPLGR